MNADETRQPKRFWTSWQGIALCALLVSVALALIVEHRAHALEWLPYALVLACPLLHLFHGHGGHGGHHGKDSGS